ncbi:MAG: Fe-S cluster assembly protein SufD [Kiritimatiellia bacterium]
MKRKMIPLSDPLIHALTGEPPLAIPSVPVWLSEERHVCRDLLQNNGLPGQGVEAWKYTDLSSINQFEWQLPSGTPAHEDIKTPPQETSDRTLHFTVLNGTYLPLPSQNIPEGVQIRTLSNPANIDCIKPVLQRTNYRLESFFAVLNRALWHDGLCITIAPDTKCNLHIHLVYGGHGSIPLLSAPRIYLKAGNHSDVALTISQWSRDNQVAMGTACIDLDLAAGARLTYAHDQQCNQASYQFTTTRIALGRDAYLHALDFAAGARLSRHDLSVSLQESGSEAHLNGIYLLRNRQTADFHTLIEHRKPHCKSRQVYKGVLDNNAHAVFNGLVEVHPGACGTDGYQLNRTLLRSPHAVIDTKPELQIHNDDVRCSHGATIGQLDPMELFYLQSRSIPTNLARAMLSRAFVADLIHLQPSEYQQHRLHQTAQNFFDQPS